MPGEDIIKNIHKQQMKVQRTLSNPYQKHPPQRARPTEEEEGSENGSQDDVGKRTKTSMMVVEHINIIDEDTHKTMKLDTKESDQEKTQKDSPKKGK